MSLKKLTLTVDAAVIERARRYSETHATSISRLVSRFLAGLPTGETRLTPTVARLSGLLPASVDAEEYGRHLEEKHER